MKDLPGYEGLYAATRGGRIWSHPRAWGSDGHFKHSGKFLKPKKNNRGYLYVSLRCGGKTRYVLVHRLVASAFIPNPSKHPVVNHKNFVTTDNEVENLEWCTYSENGKHAFNNGRITMPPPPPPPCGEDNPLAKLTAEQVLTIRSQRSAGVTGTSLAREYGVSTNIIYQIANRKVWKHLP
jgi:hypothetical protein